jgi:hypothetical protein
MNELSPDLNLSHYRIVSKIGAGGMDEVYLAAGPSAWKASRRRPSKPSSEPPTSCL